MRAALGQRPLCDWATLQTVAAYALATDVMHDSPQMPAIRIHATHHSCRAARFTTYRDISHPTANPTGLVLIGQKLGDLEGADCICSTANQKRFTTPHYGVRPYENDRRTITMDCN